MNNKKKTTNLKSRDYLLENPIRPVVNSETFDVFLAESTFYALKLIYILSLATLL